jgi:hypothetical protein
VSAVLLRTLRAVLVRAFHTLWRARRDRDVDNELESLLQLAIDDSVRIGLSPLEARRRAVAALGGIDQTRQRMRERAHFMWLDAFFCDVRYAIGAWRRRKVLVSAATLSIAFGVGVNLAAYSLLQGLLFSGWISGAPAPERLVTIAPGLSYPNYRDVQSNDLPVETSIVQASTLIWRTDASTTSVAGRVVSRNFFEVVQVRPVLGQTFTGVGDGSDAAMVTFDFWKRRLGADPTVVGPAARQAWSSTNVRSPLSRARRPSRPAARPRAGSRERPARPCPPRHWRRAGREGARPERQRPCRDLHARPRLDVAGRSSGRSRHYGSAGVVAAGCQGPAWRGDFTHSHVESACDRLVAVAHRSLDAVGARDDRTVPRHDRPARRRQRRDDAADL